MSTFIVIAIPLFALSLLVVATLLMLADLQKYAKDEWSPPNENHRHEVSGTSRSRP